jgi:transcriptional regulator with XRE-family HTH domain
MLGETIKELRKAKQLTLQNVADMTGLSVAFLSQVENDQANPTLSTLRKLSAALGTSVFALLAHGEGGDGFVKVDETRRKSFTLPRGDAVFEQLSVSMPSNRLQVLRCVLEPGNATCDEPMPHGTWNGEEWAIVLEGEVIFEVGQEQHRLVAGDCVHFHPVLPHRYQNVGTTRAVVVAVVSPPSY